jgi:gliding motility-associated-like protein
LNAPLTKNNVSCNNGNNGTATVSPTGGTQPFTYTWSPSGGNGATAISLTSGIYTVTVRDNNGCSITSTTNITQPSALNSSMNQTGVSCSGSTDGSGTVIPSGGTAPYTYLWTPSGGTGSTANNLSGGNYTVTVTDNNGCTNSNTVTVAEPAPLTNTTSQTNVPCSGGNNGTATATPNGGTAPYTYNWSSGSNNSSIANLTSGNYTVTVTDLQGCSTTSVVNISQAGSLVTTYTQSNVACSGGNSGAIDATVIGGTAPYTYTWSNGSGGQDLNNLTAGTYTLTVTDVNGCQVVINTTITQPQALSEIINSTDVACYGGNDGSINLTPSGGTLPYTFAWSDGPTTEDRLSLTTGTYTVTITDLQGCSRTATAFINEPVEPVQLNTVSSNVSCNGSSDGSATVTPIGGTSPYTYQWLPAGGSGSVANGLSGGTYTAVITDSKGCTKTASVAIKESPQLLAPLISANTPVSCTGSGNGSLTVTLTGGTAPYTYQWSPAGGSGPTANNLSGGTYTVTITDTYGCSKTATDIVNEAPQLLAPLISANTPVSCTGSGNGSLTVSVTGGSQPFTYLWSPAGGNGSSANNLSGGIYTVTVTDQYGCTKTATDQVLESPVILGINLTNSVPVTCAGNSNGSITTSVTGGTQPYTYSWSAGTSTGPSANNLPGGIYTVTVTDIFGCTKTVSGEVKESPQALGLTAGNIKNVTCTGSSDGSVTVVPNGGTQPYTYLWSPAGGNSPSANNLPGGTYTVTITDQYGCTRTVTAVVQESNTLLTGNIITTDVTCFGDGNGSATITPSGGTGPYTYAWSPTSGNGPVANGLSGGTYTVVVTDALGCSKTYTGFVTEPNKVTADFTPNPPTGLAPLYVDFTNNSSGASGYTWIFGDGTQDTVFNPTHVFTAPGEYTVMLIAYNSFGCPDTVYVKIKVVEKSRITVPNIFTPNKDGVNDLFNPIVNGLSAIRGVIYNRWGELIYKWDSPKGGWDGRTNSGLEVPDGIYYYIVDAEGSDGELYQSAGFITLVRQ